MEYKRFGNKIIVRIDKDEEILEQVKKLALKENIRLAAVQALGATNSFTVGVYNVAEKQYYANSFSGSFEIVSLTGTINTMNGEFYTHLHMSAGNDKGEVFGGHREPGGGQRHLRDGGGCSGRHGRPPVRPRYRAEPVQVLSFFSKTRKSAARCLRSGLLFIALPGGCRASCRGRRGRRLPAR